MTLITGVKGDEFYITMGCGAQAEAARMGVKLNIQGPDEFDASQQTPIVNAVAAKRPDAVLIAPTDSKALFAPIQQLSTGGAKIVLVDTTLDQADMAVSQISSDNVAGGTQAAKALVELIGSGGGKVAVVNVKPGISTTDQRAQGFSAGVKGTSLQYVGQQFDNDDPAKAASITKSMLAKNPDLKGIFATNVLTAEGVASGLREAGKKGVKVVTFDAGPKNVEDLKSGLIQGLIAQKPADIGKQGIDQAVAALKGQATTKRITTGFVTVTKDNLSSPEAQGALVQGELLMVDGTIVVAGEALVDLVPGDGDVLAAHLGGGPFNVARAVARQGGRAAYLGRLSTDHFGARLRASLGEAGVDLSLAVSTADPTTLALASVDGAGAASYSFYIDGTSAPGLASAPRRVERAGPLRRHPRVVVRPDRLDPRGARARAHPASNS